jgi:hypothetical protein
LKLIIESLQAGRERMDRYRSVFVTQADDKDHPGWRAFPEIFYRQGDRFRRDIPAAGQRAGDAVPPPADAGQRPWWLERSKAFRYFPIYVQVGPTSYTCDLKQVVDADGTAHQEVAAVQKHVSNLKPSEQFPSDYVMRPEFVCRPPMGIGNPNQEPTLDLQPAEGPAGCVLLTVRNTKEAGATAFNRYWLDPQRDYIALRWEMVTRNNSGDEIVSHSHVVEEAARSPQGVWYATKVRLKDAGVRQPDGKHFDQIYHLFVEFDTNLPDALFTPPSPRRIE